MKRPGHKPWLALIFWTTWLTAAYGQDVADHDVLPRASVIAPGQPSDLVGLDARLTLPSYSWLPQSRTGFLDAVTLQRLPPGSLIVRYCGFEGFVVKKIQSRLRRAWSDSLEQAWRAGILSDRGYQDELQAMGEDLADHRVGGRWWERDWTASLTPARGGAPAQPFVHIIGTRIEVIRIGPISLTNDLRIRLKPFVAFRFSPGQARAITIPTDRNARSHARLVRNDQIGGPAFPAMPRASSSHRVQIDLVIPQKQEREWYRVRFRPSLSVRPTSRVSDVLREVSLRVDAELYIRKSGPVRLSAALRYDVDDRDIAFVASISM